MFLIFLCVTKKYQKEYILLKIPKVSDHKETMTNNYQMDFPPYVKISKAPWVYLSLPLFDMLACYSLGPARPKKGLKHIKSYNILVNFIVKGLQRSHNLFYNHFVKIEPKLSQLMY